MKQEIEGSELFNIFLSIWSPIQDPLGPLSPQESKGLVRARLDTLPPGIVLPQPLVDCILDLGEDRPYTLNSVGQRVFELWQADPSISPEEIQRQIG